MLFHLSTQQNASHLTLQENLPLQIWGASTQNADRSKEKPQVFKEFLARCFSGTWGKLDGQRTKMGFNLTHMWKVMHSWSSASWGGCLAQYQMSVFLALKNALFAWMVNRLRHVKTGEWNRAIFLRPLGWYRQASPVTFWITDLLANPDQHGINPEELGCWLWASSFFFTTQWTDFVFSTVTYTGAWITTLNLSLEYWTMSIKPWMSNLESLTLNPNLVPGETAIPSPCFTIIERC